MKTFVYKITDNTGRQVGIQYNPVKIWKSDLEGNVEIGSQVIHKFTNSDNIYYLIYLGEKNLDDNTKA